jgi:hypothetical protein
VSYSHTVTRSGAGCWLGWRSRIHLLTQIDRSQQQSVSSHVQKGSDPHTARVRSVSERASQQSTPESALSARIRSLGQSALSARRGTVAPLPQQAGRQLGRHRHSSPRVASYHTGGVSLGPMSEQRLHSRCVRQPVVLGLLQPWSVRKIRRRLMDGVRGERLEEFPSFVIVRARRLTNAVNCSESQ